MIFWLFGFGLGFGVSFGVSFGLGFGLCLASASEYHSHQ
jgi:hypothetical protein